MKIDVKVIESDGKVNLKFNRKVSINPDFFKKLEVESNKRRR